MTNRQCKAGAVPAAFAAAVAAWLPATSAQAADGPVVHIFVVNDSIGVPVPTQDPPQISWGLDNDGPGAAKDNTADMAAGGDTAAGALQLGGGLVFVVRRRKA
ncbi:hypothetical protein [Streptomyces sp. Ag109_O5-10]|uniref:hypothetical protein n=1 Tax=Streptomyces sp. Ag109_O5-10 TaxID=1855349 RepID=UPI00089D9C4E|nr:hypothetical protein [Streptomyces sp. Ag109_O5-10]SEF03750.1 hypothetical protein SAMN05216533_5409 [Streptomyces sp. Ag109_O5-10]